MEKWNDEGMGHRASLDCELRISDCEFGNAENPEVRIQNAEDT